MKPWYDKCMRVWNETKKVALTEQLFQPKTLWQQTIGMLAFPKPVALLIKTRFGIHTFLMKYPIDVIVLDKTNRVVAIKKDLKPNRIFLWNPRYPKILELPSKTLQESKTAIGDKLQIT